MGVNIRIKGEKALMRKLKRMGDDFKMMIPAKLQESGMLLKEEIEASIDGLRDEPRSVDTGAFLASIEMVPLINGARVSSTVDHSIFLEYGTPTINERRHFRSSMDRLKPIIKEKIQDGVKEVIR